MKKLLCVVIFLIPVIVFSQTAVILDTALNNSIAYLNGRLPAKSKVVVLNFTSDWPKLSDYIIEELIGYIVNGATLTVVDRNNLEIIRQEMNFQLSGEVNDETAQSIGKKLGAQIIISGGITALGNSYRLRIRAISVETAEILGMQNVDVIQDSRIAALIGTAYTGTAVSSATSSGRKSGTTPSATNTITPAETVVIFTGTGHRYEVINTSRTWINAKSDCEKRGGYLATITNSEEQKFIEDLLSIHGKRNNYWLGGYRESRDWKWVTNEPFEYSNWMQGEPNNTGGKEDKLMMARVNPPSTSGRKGQWNDSINADNNSGGWGSYGYICEWD